MNNTKEILNSSASNKRPLNETKWVKNIDTGQISANNKARNMLGL